MGQVTFEKLLNTVSKNGHDTECIERFQFLCAVKNLTKKTMMGYAERLLYLHRYAVEIGKDLVGLTTREIQQYILNLLKKAAPETINGRIRVYKVFYKALLSEKLIQVDPMESIKSVRAEKKVKPVISPDQVAQILRQFDRKTFHGARDYCMILLTFDAMLRLSELLSIKVKDLDLTSKLVKVYGKGRKERYSPFSELTARRLRSYLNQHRNQLIGDFLFPMENGKQIQPRRAYAIFSKPGKKTGLTVYPHLLRHSGASQFIKQGGNPSVLQHVLGHSSLSITERYIHLTHGDLIDSYDVHSPTRHMDVLP